MTTKPICYDLYCGLGGWSAAFLLEGYECIGFDIEEHRYPVPKVPIELDEQKTPYFSNKAKSGLWRDRFATGPRDTAIALYEASDEWMKYPGTLILRDVRSIHGSELKDAAVIVASPPCQAYSYRAMPWKRAKDLPAPDNTLFNDCFRIQREAIEAAGHHIPLLVENVCGAQKWVGRARWHYGSFYLWGDVPALMPMTFRGAKVPGQDWSRFNNTGEVSPHWRMECAAVEEMGIKQSSISGTRKNGKGDRWFQDGAAREGSKSYKRKAASAIIAKIPLPLARHIARTYKPNEKAIA